MPQPEQEARKAIDDALAVAGWLVQDANAVNLGAGRGIAIREYPLDRGFGFADYHLYVDKRRRYGAPPAGNANFG